MSDLHLGFMTAPANFLSYFLSCARHAATAQARAMTTIIDSVFEHAAHATLAIGSALVLLHVASVAIVLLRCRRHALPAPMVGMPAVSIVRPVCGLDFAAEATLASSFALDYPRYELIFCAAHADDDAVPLVRRLIALHPQIRARLLIGETRLNANPKLNNIAKGWETATHDWIVIADSNVAMPRDLVQQMLSAWEYDTGLVCSPPAGSAPRGFWAAVECAFLNGYQARWQLAADATGCGFAQGKAMLWRRADLDRAGGMRALASELAEDAAATKVVRGLGLRVRLTRMPFPQPLGRRSFNDLWRRQARWAQLRRDSFPMFYAAEIAAGPLLPLAAAAALAVSHDVPAAAAVLATATLWYGAEMLMTWRAGWPLTWRALPAAMTRDLLLPALWLRGFWPGGFVWRGNAMHLRQATQPAQAAHAAAHAARGLD
jgi:ceramide glucosyltransferase